MVETIELLKGSGHFTVGFMAGYLLFLLMILLAREVRVRLYIPLIPFVFGAVAAFPYLLSLINVAASPVVESDIFFFYSSLNSNLVAIHLFNDLNRVALVVALLYAGIIFYYIRLIKKMRRNASDEIGRVG